VPQLSDAAQGYRRAMRLTCGVAVLALAGAFLGLRGRVPPLPGLFCGLVFLVAAALAALFGLQTQRQIRADVAKQERMQSILLVAAQLGRQDDAVLRRLAAQAGLTGDAARMILQGRAERTAASGARPRAAE
jgi:hypothetical protein